MNDNGIEEILRDKYCSYRRSHGKKNIYKEVPVFSRSVDLVEYDSHKKELTAVEFKIGDWKRAIRQLYEISTCFDFLVLCIPKPKTEKCLLNIKTNCSQMGLGLFVLDETTDSFLHVCEAVNLSDIWHVQKKQIINYLKEQEVSHE